MDEFVLGDGQPSHGAFSWASRRRDLYRTLAIVAWLISCDCRHESKSQASELCIYPDRGACEYQDPGTGNPISDAASVFHQKDNPLQIIFSDWSSGNCFTNPPSPNGNANTTVCVWDYLHIRCSEKPISSIHNRIISLLSTEINVLSTSSFWIDGVELHKLRCAMRLAVTPQGISSDIFLAISQNYVNPET